MKTKRIDADQAAVAPTDDDPGDCGERLSALLDGELDAEGCRALVERLRHDPEAGRNWTLLNCVGDAMRSADVAAFHAEGFVARVSAALAQEPTVLAPAALPRRSAVRRWLLPGASAAAAAAVLLAVGLPSRQGATTDTAAAGAPAATAEVAVNAPLPAIDRSPQLERYLAAHRELAEATLMPYSTPYVRTSGAVLMQEGR